MTPTDLRAWQAAMGYTYDSAAEALGINRSTYADLLSGVSRATGKPKDVDRRTALACAAIAAGLPEWELLEIKTTEPPATGP